MKSVYLSARFERREELQEYQRELETLGIQVIARWLEVEPPSGTRGLSEDELQELAELDLEDVSRADGFVCFSDPAGARDGAARHVEFGIAVAMGKPIVVVGCREHLFHRLPEISVVEDWGDALRLLLNQQACALETAGVSG